MKQYQTREYLVLTWIRFNQRRVLLTQNILNSHIFEIIAVQEDRMNVVLFANTLHILAVTVTKTCVLFVWIFSAVLVLIFLHINVFTDFDPKPLYPTWFADNGVTGGVKGKVKKVSMADQMSSVWNYLYACDVLLVVELEGYVFDCFVFDLRHFGNIKSETILRELDTKVHMTMVQQNISWIYLDVLNNIFRGIT